MIRAIFRIAVCLVSAAAVFSCDNAVPGFSKIEYTIPGHIKITADELKRNGSVLKIDPGSRYHAEMVIYSYSPGVESISFSGGDLASSRSDGWIRGLIKIMDGDRIIGAVFIEGRGKTREEMLSSLINNAVYKLNR